MKKKISFSIKAKLLSMILIPPIILSVTLTYMATTNIKAGMQDEAFNGLRGMAHSIQQIYSSIDAGDYTADANGNVMKGALQISGNYAIVDNLKASTHYDVTIFYGDTRVTTSLTDASGNRLVGTQASEVVIQNVLNGGNEYSDPAVVINNTPYYGYYVPITQNGSVVGMAFAGAPSTEVNAFIQQKTTAIVTICITVLAVIVVLGFIFAMSMAKAIQKAESVISEMGKGNLKVTVDEKTKKRGDELGSMTREMENFIHQLSGVITNIKQSSSVLFTSGTSLEEMATQSSNTTDEISKAVEGVSRGANSQAEETETASRSVEEMGDVITEIVGSVDHLGQASLDMKDASDASTEIIIELSESNDKTTAAIGKIGEQVYSTNNSVQEIQKAVEIITSIAEETNLLSLNASIEAARAGEHGRGFAVVASQIQKLAEESNRSALEITQIINGLLKESETTVQVMDEVNIIVKEQQVKLEQTKEKFKQVAAGVDSTRNETELIQKQTAICDNARGQIIDVIANLSAISEENAASTEETTAAMEELNAMLNLLAESSKELLELAIELDKSMEFFNI